MKKMTRREMLQVTAGATAIVPLGMLGGRVAVAEELPQLDPSDPTAQALEYVHESTTPEQWCKNCQLYGGKEGSEWGPCQLFPGKGVSASGWCKSWVLKTG